MQPLHSHPERADKACTQPPLLVIEQNATAAEEKVNNCSFQEKDKRTGPASSDTNVEKEDIDEFSTETKGS